MNYEQKLHAEMDRNLAELMEVAKSFQRMATDTGDFVDQYTEKRTDPTRGNRLPSYDEKQRAKRMNELNSNEIYGFTGAETIELDNDLNRSPAQDFAMGRYENALLSRLDSLREDVKTYYERYQFGNPNVRQANLARVRTTLELIRIAQRQLNSTGHWNFGLV